MNTLKPLTILAVGLIFFTLLSGCTHTSASSAEGNSLRSAKEALVVKEVTHLGRVAGSFNGDVDVFAVRYTSPTAADPELGAILRLSGESVFVPLPEIQSVAYGIESICDVHPGQSTPDGYLIDEASYRAECGVTVRRYNKTDDYACRITGGDGATWFDDADRLMEVRDLLLQVDAALGE